MPVTGDLNPIDIYAAPGHQLHLWLLIAAAACAVFAIACIFTAARPWTAYLYRYSIAVAAAGFANCIAAFGFAITALLLQ